MMELGSTRVTKFGLHIQLPTIDAPTPKNTARTRTDSTRSVGVVTPKLADAKSSKYKIDINTIQKNIDRITMADQTKGDIITPKDLYRKAHPGLVPANMDYTDPRQWYSSSATKKIMNKFATNYQPTKSVHNATQNLGTGQVAFFVTFPNIRQSDKIKELDISKTRPTKQSAGSDASSRRFPEIKSRSSFNDRMDPTPTKSNIQIRHFAPNIDKGVGTRSQWDREMHASTDSQDFIGRKVKKRDKTRSKSNTPDTDKRTTPIPRIEFTIPTALNQYQHKPNPSPKSVHEVPVTSSAVNRELSESVEDIVKSLTSFRGEEGTLRVLQQAPSTSIELPVIESNVVKGETNSTAKNTKNAQQSYTHTSMKKSVSYQSLHSVGDMYYPYEDQTIVKAESMESLLTPTGSRDKYLKLRLPQQRSEIDEIKHFRDTYSLRQISNLNLNMKNTTINDKRKTSTTSIKKPRASHDQNEVQSKVGVYIHGHLPDHYIVVPDSKGEPRAVELPPQKRSSKTDTTKTTMDKHREKVETSMSDIPKDASSEVYTLGTPSVRSQQRGREPGVSDIEDINHPQRSARSPNSKAVSIKPDREDGHSLPANRPPSQLSTVKPHNPAQPRKMRQKYLAVSDSALYKIGREKTVVNLSVTQRKPPTRRKTLIRAIDKYIQEKLGHRLQEQEELAVKLVVAEHRQRSTLDRVTEQNTPISRNESTMVSRELTMRSREPSTHPLLQQTTRIQVTEPPVDPELQESLKGKRGVYRARKMVTPFQERVRPLTKGGLDGVIVYEEYLNKKKYQSQLRPPSFRLDLRQYPPNRPSISRDASFDQRKSSIVQHTLDRTITECDLKFPSRITSGVDIGIKAETESRYTSETTPRPPGNSKPFKRGRKPRNPGGGGGGYIEFHVVNTEKEADADQQQSTGDGFDLDAYMEAQIADEHRESDTPADSIDATMMKEIYENLDTYLVRMGSRGHDGMSRDRTQHDLIME